MRGGAGPIRPDDRRPPAPYRPDIDGLRALAVTAVILFHYGLGPFSGGFVGVDVFFVISGYLITGLIAPDVVARRLSVVGFYERRIRRILPALLLVLLATACVSPFVFLPNDMRLLGTSLIHAALFTSNILYFSLANDYFAADNLTLQPLLHSWSLAVEAQFYLVYPAILIAGHRWSIGSRRLLWALTLISFGLGSWGAWHSPDAAFYLLPQRFWELALGGLLALGGRPVLRSARAAGGIAALGLVLIVLATLAYGRATPFPGLAALAPCLGAALVLAAGEAPAAATTLAGRLLRLRGVVALGRLSYSLYLWHWPLIVFARYGQASDLVLWERLALLGATLVLSVASFRLIERPCIERRLLTSRRALLAAAAGGVALVAACGESLDLAGRGLLPIAQLPQAVLTLANGQFDRIEGECWPQQIAPDAGLPCRFGDPKAAPDILVWGNSYGRMWVPALDIAANEHHAAGLALVRSKCPPLTGASFPGLADCAAFNAAALDFLRAHPAFRTVVLGANWFDWTASLPALERTVAALTGMHRRVLILLAPPQADYAVPRVLALAALRHAPPPPPLRQASAKAAQASSDRIIAAIAASSGAGLIDPARILCDGTLCAVERDGHALYYDAGHITRTAALQSAALFEPLFSERAP